MSKRRLISVVATSVLAITGWAATLPSQAEERFTFAAGQLEIRNVIGEFRITGHGGSEFEVVVRIDGKDADSGGIEVVRKEQGDRGTLTIQFPASGKFVYPRMGKTSKTSFTPGDRNGDQSWLSEALAGLFGKKVTVRGSGSGLELWADVEVRVPVRGELVVRHGVGEIQATDVGGNLQLGTVSGRVEVDGVDGELKVETGSGHVELARVDGEKLSVGTGSGHVEAIDVRASKANIATGSGRVNLEKIESPSLQVATGSGSVEAIGVSADQVQIATGSGSVRLQLDHLGDGQLGIGTGSGRVTLELPLDASVEVYAETGSGGIDVNLDGELQVHHKERDQIEFTMGGGDSRVRIGTGSGGIRIAHGTR